MLQPWKTSKVCMFILTLNDHLEFLQAFCKFALTCWKRTRNWVWLRVFTIFSKSSMIEFLEKENGKLVGIEKERGSEYHVEKICYYIDCKF